MLSKPGGDAGFRAECETCQPGVNTYTVPRNIYAEAFGARFRWKELGIATEDVPAIPITVIWKPTTPPPL